MTEFYAGSALLLWRVRCSSGASSLLEMLAFRPRTRAKSPLPQLSGNRARHFIDPQLAKN